MFQVNGQLCEQKTILLLWEANINTKLSLFLQGSYDFHVVVKSLQAELACFEFQLKIEDMSWILCSFSF